MTKRMAAPWMCPLDERTLEILREEAMASPSHIANEVSLRTSQNRVKERCILLSRAGLVAPISQDWRHYEITAKGEEYLDGELDARGLPRPPVAVV
jgi:predicted transcriptional regulator